ncbi:hypothetical protein ACGFNU_25580 [Spirillospora sp. NPDC048911]|uniref:hypothetical protein n=1 Tax=Spirillospora sp. NPDC048911 TaxID=3364527 RepID=UPI003713723F
MRFLIMLAALALLAAVIVLLLYGLRGTASKPASAKWETHTEANGGITTIIVRQVTGQSESGRQVIASIPDDDADWETRYHEAMAQARSRVAALESQAD